MTILVTLLNVLAIAFLARWGWKKLAPSDTAIYWSALMLRFIAGISVGVLYMYYYNGAGDTFTLFNEALSPTSSGDPRSRYFISIVRFINIVTFENYWITSLWLSLFSFICSYRLVVTLDRMFPSIRVASRVALLFTPSVVFWTSGVLKESIAFAAVAMLTSHFLSIMDGRKLKAVYVASIFFFLILLLNLKYYWAGVLLPCMVAAIVVQKINPEKFIGSYFVAVFLLFAFAVSFMHPNFYIERLLSVIVENHNTIVNMSRPETVIGYYDLKPAWTSMLINSPWALWSGLFRPMIFEVHSLTTTLAAIENLFLLILVFWKLKAIRLPAVENRLVVLTALIYIVVLCIFLAISAPNLGTLSRYRVGFLPFFVLLIFAQHPILTFKWKTR